MVEVDDEKYKIHKECFDKVIKMPFEHITINAPIGYDEVLRSEYGDYMAPVKGTSCHDYPFMVIWNRNLFTRLEILALMAT